MDDKDKIVKLDPETERNLVAEGVQKMNNFPDTLPVLFGYLNTNITTFEQELKAALEEQKALRQLIQYYIGLSRVMINRSRELYGNRTAPGG